MNSQDQYEIAPLEMTIVLMSMIIGVGILTIPRSLTTTLESPDGWISIGITGLMVMLLVYLYASLQNQYPGQTLFDYLYQGKVGKWIASLLIGAFIVYFLSLLAFEARVLSFVVKMYLLNETPSEALVAIILLTTTYAVTKGVQGVVHLSLLFMPIILLLIILFLIANLPNMDIDKMLPVMGDGIMPVIEGTTEISLSYLGVEILFFMMVYMKQENLRAFPLNVSVSVITLLYIFTFIMVVTIFGVEGTQVITFPTVEAIKEIEVPGAFFERLESLMITIWIMTIFNTMSTIQLITFLTIKKQLQQLNEKILLSTIVFITYTIAFIPNSITDVFTFSDWIGWLGVSLFGLSLICGFFTVWFRKKKTSSHTSRGM
ncbi:GerAB/ArcD/ProY family transporter [Alkalihalobacillus sp. BA299]|uniref:GerAB/ArcD/ProY family transporter n=1 Tax=Alkalihalobacillus sp. BA299 TaxID=2815938 RepID=UPI001ADC94E5|nr:GerAB/ArcD/ProY family transporter [Alkalihalobacillus sp. BA299]